MPINTKTKKLKKKSEFRFHPVYLKTKNGIIKLKNHPTYIFYKEGNIRIYVPITHSKKIKGKIVIKLRKNPNPTDAKESYYIDDIYMDEYNNFGQKIDGWAIDNQDDIDIRNNFKKKIKAQ